MNAHTRPVTFRHTDTTTRQVTLDVPTDVDDDDIEQWFYENTTSDEGEIVGGGYALDQWGSPEEITEQYGPTLDGLTGDRGATLVEYAFIVALVALVGIASMAALQFAIGDVLSHVIDRMNSEGHG